MRIVIIAVAYNRIDSLRRLLESLERADYPESATLIVSVDKSNTDVVERFALDYQWPYGEKRVALHTQNLGLRAHMLSLGQYFAEFDALIVLEDDITVSPSFYHFALACSKKYYDDDRIAGISLYSFGVNYQNYLPFTPVRSEHDVYLMNCAQSWGEVWMKPAWKAFIQWYESHNEDFNLEYLPRCLNNWPCSSWLKYYTRHCIEQDKYFVFPYVSLSTNNSDPGVNAERTDTIFQANLLAAVQTSFRLPCFDEAEVRYDGFFQPRFLGRHLGIVEEELCVDFFSEKPRCLYRHYLLTNRVLPYKLINSFALQLRPIEMNIICCRKGHELFFYDTTQPASLPKAPDRYLSYAWFYGKGFYKVRTMIGLPRSIALFWEMICKRFK